MSKIRVATRERIRDKALEMFNERGIEYVGLRELAAVLDMRVSNITYYFPTKDDLVYTLSLDLSKANAAVLVASENLTMVGFLQMIRLVFRNHVTYRCLLLSVVHLMKQNRHMALAYEKTQKIRTATIKSNLQALELAGYLKVADETVINFLVSNISLINRFWISEAAVSNQHLGTEAQIKHYLELLTKLLTPYVMAKGKKEIHEFLGSIQ